MSFHEAMARGEVTEYVGSVGISSWDDDGFARERASYNRDDDEDADRRWVDDEGGMFHDYGRYCECSECLGEVS